MLAASAKHLHLPPNRKKNSGGLPPSGWRGGIHGGFWLARWISGLPQSSPRFATSLPEFRHPDASADVWGIALDGKCPDSRKGHIRMIWGSTLEIPLEAVWNYSWNHVYVLTSKFPLFTYKMVLKQGAAFWFPLLQTIRSSLQQEKNKTEQNSCYFLLEECRNGSQA